VVPNQDYLFCEDTLGLIKGYGFCLWTVEKNSCNISSEFSHFIVPYDHLEKKRVLFVDFFFFLLYFSLMCKSEIWVYWGFGF
jgi:hypothetical protein